MHALIILENAERGRRIMLFDILSVYKEMKCSTHAPNDATLLAGSHCLFRECSCYTNHPESPISLSLSSKQLLAFIVSCTLDYSQEDVKHTSWRPSSTRIVDDDCVVSILIYHLTTSVRTTDDPARCHPRRWIGNPS